MQERIKILIQQKIEEAQSKRENRERIKLLLSENDMILTPEWIDLRMIPDIARVCNELRSTDNGATKRKRSLFIILLMYAPSVLLLGDRMPYRLRKELTRVYKTNPSLISNDVSNLMLLYNRYSDFREDICTLILKLKIFSTESEIKLYLE